MDVIEKIQWDFLWGRWKEFSGIYLVVWKDICNPKARGGLGMKRIRDTNKALLMKWLWRFGVEDSLWCKFIVVKYGGS